MYKNHIIDFILYNYIKKYIEPFVVQTPHLLNDYNSVKQLFIDKIKQSIMDYINILNLIFQYKINKRLIKSVTLNFCNSFNNNVSHHLKNTTYLVKIDNNIIGSFFIYQTKMCLTNDFSFHKYINYKIKITH